MLLFAVKLYDVGSPAEIAFEKDYPGALYAQWENVVNSDIYAVRFIHNSEAVLAYYDAEGNSIASARMISMDCLPDKVKQKIATLYGISEIINIQEWIINTKLNYFLPQKK